MVPPMNTNVAASSQQKRVCPNCQREFKNGRALGAHSKVHFKNRRKIKFTHTKHSSKARQDLSMSLSELRWECQRKRSNGRRRRTPDVHDESYDADVDDDDGNMVMERLISYGFSGTAAHKICRTRRMYLCNSCDVYLPTFHSVLFHVNQSRCSATLSSLEVNGEVGAKVAGDEREQQVGDDAEISTKVDQVGDKEEGGVSTETFFGVNEVGEDQNGEMDAEVSMQVDEVAGEKEEGEEKAEEAAGVEEDEMRAKATTEVDEAVDTRGNSGSMDSKVSTSDPPKMLDFDLNEMPHKED